MTSDWIWVDGVKLEVARWGGGTRLPLLLLHEGLGSVRLWKDFPASLAEATGREVVAWSRQGHGWSDRATQVRRPDYMHREAMAVPQVMERLGIERAHLLGHSDGASIALIAAALHPEGVSSLTLEAPHVLVEDMTYNSIAEIAAGFSPADMGERMKRFHADPLGLFAIWSAIWLDPAFRTWNIEDLLTQITAPALLIQGKDDQYGTLDQLDRIAAVLARTQRLELDHCRHSPHFDRTDDVLEAIYAFLADKD